MIAPGPGLHRVGLPEPKVQTICPSGATSMTRLLNWSEISTLPGALKRSFGGPDGAGWPVWAAPPQPLTKNTIKRPRVIRKGRRTLVIQVSSLYSNMFPGPLDRRAGASVCLLDELLNRPG